MYDIFNNVFNNIAALDANFFISQEFGVFLGIASSACLY